MKYVCKRLIIRYVYEKISQFILISFPEQLILGSRKCTQPSNASRVIINIIAGDLTEGSHFNYYDPDNTLDYTRISLRVQFDGWLWNTRI